MTNEKAGASNAMNADHREHPSADEPLDRLLRTWELQASLPAGFRQRVWQGVAEQIARADTNPWEAFLAVFSRVFRRPVWVVAYTCGVLLIGLGVGYWKAQSANDRLNSTLARRYVQSVAPFEDFASPLK